MVVSPFTLLKKMFTTKLGRGSLILIISSFVVGGFSFLFNPIMGVLLGPVGYGELLTMLSLLVILSVPTQTISAVLIKFTATYLGKDNLSQVKSLNNEITKKFLILSVVVLVFFWFFSPLVASFLQVKSNLPIILIGVLTIATFLFTINSSFLQGLLKFEAFSIASLLSTFLKVVFASFLVWWGFGVSGAIGAIILALVVAYLVSFLFLEKVLRNEKTTKVNWGELKSYTYAALIANLGLTFLNNLDIVIVKHFFAPIDAGYYSAGVLTSRVIVFSTLPIIQIIFPLVTQRQQKSAAYHHLVVYALLITTAIGVVTSVFYLMFPDITLKLFFFSRAADFAGAKPILGIFSIYVLLYSISYLLTYLFLSLHKVKFSYAPLVAGIAQAVLVWIYHPSLVVVVWEAIFINSLLAAVLLGYYYWLKR